jgi:hypothetical protein
MLGEVESPVAKKPRLEVGALPNLSLPSGLGYEQFDGLNEQWYFVLQQRFCVEYIGG